MSNNETLADVLAEMRRHIQAVRDYPQDIDITDGDVEDWTDRIEAAYARDIGNAAALREAVKADSSDDTPAGYDPYCARHGCPHCRIFASLQEAMKRKEATE